MAKPFNGKRPQDLGQTLRTFLSYLGRHRVLLILVGILAAVSASASLLGTYMIKPIVKGPWSPFAVECLIHACHLAKNSIHVKRSGGCGY